MRRILLFDTIIDGHHADYLAHLVNYWLRYQPEGELLVVTQASFEATFQQLRDDTANNASVRFIPIPPEDIERTHQSSALSRSFSEWNLLLKYVHDHQPTHALIMYFDIFQLGSWLGKKAPCAISGIYFRPDFHYAIPPGLKARLNVLRKKVTLRGMLNRGVLTNLFCLDHSAVSALKQMNPRVNVLALPDPVKSYDIKPAETKQLRAELGIEAGRNVFLLFGHLDDRKGIEPLLEALKQLNPALRSTLCLLLVGSIRSVYQAGIEQLIAEIDSQIQIVCVFKEVRGRQIQTYFELSDYALALYQRHIGMASVFIRAAVSGKPILSSDYGYMGRFVQTAQLGAVTDSTSPTAICQLLEQVLTQGVSYSETNLKKVADQNSDVAFAETIFNRL
ncbi:glycosyltransferase [Spirosoma soli]|uniref:Glycosyltransferase n=1 Tax=Spirosoma soli TaxID=1770529 RepID=A0ABW5M7Q4_9BACT